MQRQKELFQWPIVINVHLCTLILWLVYILISNSINIITKINIANRINIVSHDRHSQNTPISTLLLSGKFFTSLQKSELQGSCWVAQCHKEGDRRAWP